MLQRLGTRHRFVVVAILATWLQTYFAYMTAFQLDIENVMQQIILFLNPLAAVLFIYGISFFFKTRKGRNRYIVTTKIILSVVLYGNIVFYRFYNDFVTLPVLFQTNNFGDLGGSVAGLVKWTDVFYFTDTVLLIVLLLATSVAKEFTKLSLRPVLTYFSFSFAVLCLNLGLAEIERPQLLTRSFDREVLVKNIGTYNYHLYDVYVQTKTEAQKAFADSNELTQIIHYVNRNEVKVNEDFYGIAENKNVLIISLESMQNFVIHNRVNEREITPFLNELTKDADTLYFDNFYHQTGLGKTSDAEFIVENSLFGVSGGAVFFTNANNAYNSLSEKLADYGYSTNVFHANNKSFWNRDIMYKSLGIDTFYDEQSYEINDENAVNWGLKDIPFIEQSVQLMTTLQQPFSARMLTLTNHFPFTSNPEDQFIEAYTSDDVTVNQYFQTVRYTDEAIRTLFRTLKEKKLYDDTVIVMYGDHYGISENHQKAMAQYLQKEQLTPYDNVLLQKVPFYIHIPNSNIKQKGEPFVHEVGGQLDIRPTILHLLGLSTKRDLQMGTDLLSTKHNNLMPFRDGRFVSNDVIYTKNQFYDAHTGKKLRETTKLKKMLKDAQEKTDLSDKLINGDLFRFYDEKSGTISE